MFASRNQENKENQISNYNHNGSDYNPEPTSPCVGVSAINKDSTFPSPTPSSHSLAIRKTPGAEKNSLRNVLASLGWGDSSIFENHPLDNEQQQQQLFPRRNTSIFSHSMWGHPENNMNERFQYQHQNQNYYSDDAYLYDENEQYFQHPPSSLLPLPMSMNYYAPPPPPSTSSFNSLRFMPFVNGGAVVPGNRMQREDRSYSSSSSSSSKPHHQSSVVNASFSTPSMIPNASSSSSSSSSSSLSSASSSSSSSSLMTGSGSGGGQTHSEGQLVESPGTKMKFKTFYKTFKEKEKEGFEAAKMYANEFFPLISEKSHWRIFLELADFAKRENRIQEARYYFQTVNAIQPYASQGWLEFAKMVEECGDLDECKDILAQGLLYCPFNESLMVKSLKHFERMRLMNEARRMLGTLKGVPVEKTWRTLMEGALMEARQGNYETSRKVFKFLTQSVSWCGPIYLEACKFEEKCEEWRNAMNFVEKGLKENPRYGPLWFCALRLHERLSPERLTFMIAETIEAAIKSISKELIWKLYFEAGQIIERTGDIQLTRNYLVKAVDQCPDNLLWKVWVAGAKTELFSGNPDVARKLLRRALKEVPAKMKPTTYLECSRLEEYCGKLDDAREILLKAKTNSKQEWKVFLESILLEIRANNYDAAITEAKEALAVHSGTGRLWASLIQLRHSAGDEKQIKVFKKALREVPKSGEVWCEGARIAIRIRDFESARHYINFAIQFTPQYGDSFIEYLRLELLEKGVEGFSKCRSVELACVNADPNYGTLWLYCKQNPNDSPKQVLREAYKYLTQRDENGKVDLFKNLNVNTIFHGIHQRSETERKNVIFV